MEQIKVTDDLLCEAFRNLSNEMIDEWENKPAVKHTFSKKFERRMKTLIKKEKNRELFQELATIGKRLALPAAVLAVVFIIFFANGINAKADPKLWFQKMEVILEDSSMYVYDQEMDKYYFTPYEPTYVPEGYTEVSRLYNGGMLKIDYINDMSERIIWYQNIVMDSTLAGMNAEYNELKILEYAGENIYIYVYEDGYKFLYYESGNSVFTMSVSDISIKDMYKMIEEMQQIEK